MKLRFCLLALPVLSLTVALGSLIIFPKVSVDRTHEFPSPPYRSSPTAAGKGQQHAQRIVLLAGPHKTASTSVQAFLLKLVKRGILRNWKWPGGQAPKAHAGLAKFVMQSNEGGGIWRGMHRFEQSLKSGWDEGQNVVIAAEAFDILATLPEFEAHEAIRRLLGLLFSGDMEWAGLEVVIMYRTPRASHLVSAWKQQIALTGKRGATKLPWKYRLEGAGQTSTNDPTKKSPVTPPPTLSEWLCHAKWDGWMAYNVETIVSAQLNPLGVADAYSRHGNANVTVIDMAGVKDSDVPSAVACDILDLACKDSEVVGIEKASRVQNKRSNPTKLGMSDKELEEAEIILRKMDCYYYCRLRDRGLIVLHGKDDLFMGGGGWRGCCEETKGNVDAAEAARMLRELGCRSSWEQRM